MREDIMVSKFYQCKFAVVGMGTKVLEQISSQTPDRSISITHVLTSIQCKP